MRLRSVRVWDAMVEADGVFEPNGAVVELAAPLRQASRKSAGQSKWYETAFEQEEALNYTRALKFYDLAIADGDQRAMTRKEGLLEMYADVLAGCKARIAAGKPKSAATRLDILIERDGKVHGKEAAELRATLE